MKILRTPDERFDGLADYPFAPHYCEIPAAAAAGAEDGQNLRVHYVDEGKNENEIILCLHGEPSWSYLYRKMIPPFVAAGFRVLAPDLVGFGKSDKPSSQDDYSYKNHLDWMSAWLEKIDGKNLTLVCQDWGGLIGLRLVCATPERFKRVVVANTGLPIGTGMSEGFKQWLEFSQNAPKFAVGSIVSGGTQNGLSDEAIAAYDAPFPSDEYKSAARSFPRFVPVTAEHPQVAENKKAWEVLSQWDKPLLTAFSDGDPVSAGGDVIFQEKVKGAQGQPHTTMKGGGHFLQEDCGEALAAVVVDFIKRTQ